MANESLTRSRGGQKKRWRPDWILIESLSIDDADHDESGPNPNPVSRAGQGGWKRRESMLKRLALFGSELLSNPRAIGAACPSSPLLARRMARSVRPARGRYVLELGAGTGAITEALLESSVSGDRLVVVEKSPVLVKVLRRRFSNATVLEGDAAQLDDLVAGQLGLKAEDFSHVVSSLPLRSIPRPAAEGIARAIEAFLGHGASLVQFTYDLRNGSRDWYGGLRHVRSSVVWLNVPPARVDVYQSTGRGGPG